MSDDIKQRLLDESFKGQEAMRREALARIEALEVQLEAQQEGIDFWRAAALRASAVAEPVASSPVVAWECTDDRYPAIKGIVTDRHVTVDAWQQEGIEFAKLGRIAHPAPAATVPESVFDRLDAFFTETKPYGYAKDNSAIEQFLVKARDALASLPAPVAAPTREGRHPVESLWRECGLPEYFLGNDGSNTKLYALYDAILALKAAPAK